MTPLDLAKALLQKGRADERLCRRVVDDTEIEDELFGFHAQQAVEKYLKAVLAIDEEQPEKTHNLHSLSAQCEEAGRPLPQELESVLDVSPFAVEARYPFAKSPTIDRRKVLEQVDAVRLWAEQEVGVAPS